MSSEQQTNSVRFLSWFSGTSMGKYIYPNHIRLVVFFYMLCFHSIYWFTAWWSPWPFLTLSVIAFWLSGGVFNAWNSIISQALHTREFDTVLLKIILPFTLLNYIAIFACLYMFGDVIGADGERIEGEWKHFYFSAVTMTTLGYGNTVPADMFAEVVATIQTLIGFMAFGILAGLVGSIVIFRHERH